MATTHQVSVTGYTSIPADERVARPTGRTARDSRWTRLRRELSLRRVVRRERTSRARAEAAQAPTVTDPRQVMIVRHPENEIRRF